MAEGFPLLGLVRSACCAYKMTMKKNRFVRCLYAVPLAVLLGLLLAACATAPYTERSQLMLVSDSQAREVGLAAAQEVIQQEPVEQGTPAARTVERIGRRISAVTKGDYNWRFFLIDKDVPNAFALPSGDIFIYKGMFPYAKTEDQLAAVIGHEIAHVIVRHGAERMSVAMASQTATSLAGAAMGSGQAAQLLGIAANVGVVLPYSRTQESEADRVGLILMAKAGYPPDAAVTLWRNMEANASSTPEFLSTHPSPGNRVENIKKQLPEARGYLPR